jgi:hypothetical protein
MAFADSNLFDEEGGAVPCVDGSVELLDEPELSGRIEQFVAESEAARGQRPDAIEPRGGAGRYTLADSTVRRLCASG